MGAICGNAGDKKVTTVMKKNLGDNHPKTPQNNSADTEEEQKHIEIQKSEVFKKCLTSYSILSDVEKKNKMDQMAKIFNSNARKQLKQIEGDIDQYVEKLHVISKSTYHESYVARCVSTDMLVNVKEISKDKLGRLNKTFTKLQQNEYDTLSNIDHPGVVKMLSLIEGNQQFYILSEYVSGGTIKEVFNQHQGLS